jgi:hypothetical protein
VWETSDPDGVQVLLTVSTWRHIVDRHPELSHARTAILGVVRFPETTRPGHARNEEWFYGRYFAGPTRWVRVVVHYHDDRGRITTAVPRTEVP